MDDDVEFLPPSHPLRVYLRDLNLDDVDEIDPYDKPKENELLKNVTKRTSLFSRILSYVVKKFHDIESYPRKHLLDRLIHSGYVLSDDRVRLQGYKKELEKQDFHNFPWFKLLCALSFLLTFFAANSNSLLLSVGITVCALLLLNFCFTILNVVFLKCVVNEMEVLFSKFLHSVKFLRGLVGVEMGFIFAGRGGISRNQLSKVVLPNLTAKLFDSIKLYTVDVLSITQKINELIMSSDSLSSRLAEISDFRDSDDSDLEEALSDEKNLRSIKVLLETVFQLNSEIARVFGSFLTTHFNESFIVYLNVIRLLGMWLLIIVRAKSNLKTVELMQINLLKGQISSDKPFKIPSVPSSSSSEDINVEKMQSALSSLHFNVLSLSLRIHNLREKVTTKCKDISLSDLVTADIESMHTLINSCRLCLDEASAVLRTNTEQSSPPHTPNGFPKLLSEEGSAKLIPLESVVPVEYECLEAVVGEDDNQSNGIDDEFYDEFDNLGRPLTKTEKQRLGKLTLEEAEKFIFSSR